MFMTFNEIVGSVWSKVSELARIPALPNAFG